MKKALTEILRITNKQQKIINISIVEKESEMGFTFNSRLFFLVEGDRFGYISNFKETDKPQDIDISKSKLHGLIKYVSGEIERTNQIIRINFYVLEDKKKVNKKWVLKMATESLAKDWQKLFDEEKNKSLMKSKSVDKNKNSGLSPMKSDVRGNNPNPVMKEENSHKNLERVRSELKDDYGKRKNQKQPQKQQYQNALYESQHKAPFVMGPQNEPASLSRQGNQQTSQVDKKNYEPESQQSRENISKKLNYENEDERERQRQRSRFAEKKREEEEHLRREKEEIAKKQKELEELERTIREEQRKIQRERKLLEEKKKQESIISQSRNNTKNKETVINESYFQKPKDKEMLYKDHQVGESGIRKQDPRESSQYSQESQESRQETSSPQKQRPKLEGTSYSELVSPIVVENSGTQELNSEDAPTYREKTLLQTHNYLLKLEEMKMQEKEEKGQKGDKIQMSRHQKVENAIEEKEEETVPLEFGWTYRFLLKQADGSQDDIISEFNDHCCSILKQVVSQFHLPQRKRNHLPKYRREQYLLYQKQDIQYKVGLISLKQVYSCPAWQQPGSSSRQTICNKRPLKLLTNEYKKYSMLYRVCNEIGAKSLRVPLVCLCEYEGFVALFRVRAILESKNATALDKNVQLDLEKISEVLGVGGAVLSNRDNLLVYRLNSHHYKTLAQQHGNQNVNFDYYMVEQVKNILPKDPLNSATSQSLIRPQLLLSPTPHPQPISQTISSTLQQLQQSRSPIPSSLDRQQQRLCDSMMLNIACLVEELEELHFYFVHPEEISQRMHYYGIGVRMLGLIYRHTQLQFCRKFIMSEMAARSARMLFRKTIQDCHMKESFDSHLVFEEGIRYQIIDFMNLILGNSNETVTIWEVLSTHNEHYFNTPINTEQIQKGYFFQSLMYHCGIDVEWTQINLNDLFVSNQILNQDNFIGTQAKVKGYDPFLTPKEQGLVEKILEEDPTAIKILEQQYSIQTNGLPLKFRNKKYLPSFQRYLSNFIPPEASVQRGYRLLNLYSQPRNHLSHHEYSLKLMQLKWHLKRQKKQKYLQVFSQLNSEIVNCFGNYHPFLSELYDTMVLYHRNNGEFEDSITFSKSSVVNMLKVCGASHVKVAEAYYQMAYSCMKGGKKEHAIISLQKAKNIFEGNQKEGEISYAYVCMKLGLMFLSEGKDAQNIVRYALKLFNRASAENINNNIPSTYQQERVECYEILSRYYQLNQLSQSQRSLSLECQKQLPYMESPASFQKMLKIVLYPLLIWMSRVNASTYLSIISSIPMAISIDAYTKGFQRIMQRVQEDSLVETLTKYLDNVQAIDKFIKDKQVLREWKGLTDVHQRETVADFVALTVELVYFLGQGFVTGTIRDAL